GVQRGGGVGRQPRAGGGVQLGDARGILPHDGRLIRRPGLRNRRFISAGRRGGLLGLRRQSCAREGQQSNHHTQSLHRVSFISRRALPSDSPARSLARRFTPAAGFHRRSASSIIAVVLTTLLKVTGFPSGPIMLTVDGSSVRIVLLTIRPRATSNARSPSPRLSPSVSVTRVAPPAGGLTACVNFIAAATVARCASPDPSTAFSVNVKLAAMRPIV